MFSEAKVLYGAGSRHRYAKAKASPRGGVWKKPEPQPRPDKQKPDTRPRPVGEVATDSETRDSQTGVGQTRQVRDDRTSADRGRSVLLSECGLIPRGPCPVPAPPDALDPAGRRRQLSVTGGRATGRDAAKTVSGMGSGPRATGCPGCRGEQAAVPPSAGRRGTGGDRAEAAAGMGSGADAIECRGSRGEDAVVDPGAGGGRPGASLEACPGAGSSSCCAPTPSAHTPARASRTRSAQRR